MLWRTIRPLLDYTRTAPIAALRKSVRASEGLPALINDIDSQLATLDPTTRRSGSLLLPTWLLNVTKNSFSVMSSSDVVWVAPYTVTKKLYSIIPLSKSHEVRVIDRAGRIIALGVQEARFQEVLTAFYHWAPWAVVGSDPAMDARFGQKKGWRALSGFSKSTPSKTDLIKSIDKRREEIFANWAAQARAGEDASAQASSAQPPASATGRTR